MKILLLFALIGTIMMLWHMRAPASREDGTAA